MTPLARKLYLRHCKRCGNDWAARSSKPKRCGKCKSPYWKKERKSVKLGAV